MYDYRGTLTEDDYVEVSRLRRTIVPNVRTLADWSGLFAGCFAVMGVWAYIGSRDNLLESMFWFALVIPCSVYWWYGRYDPRKEWRNTPVLREEFYGRITESALEARLTGTEARIPWKMFQTYAASPTVILLLVGPHMALPLARSFFGGDDIWESVNRLVSQNVQTSNAKTTVNWSSIILWIFIALLIFLFWSVSKRLEQ
jgi:hypothetical protein